MQNEQEIGEITEILSRWTEAKEESLDIVFPMVYEKLKHQARKARRNIGRVNNDETLTTTVLVNEMYLKLRKNANLLFDKREQFYIFCRVSMQHLLHDYYFRKSSKKHEVVFIDESDESRRVIENLINLSEFKDLSGYANSLELSIAFDEALSKLGEKHPRKVEIVILKYWLDETEQEIADILNISKSSVRRDLAMAIPLIRSVIDERMKSALNEANDITQTTVRNYYLNKIAGDDQNFLNQLVIMLKDMKKNKSSTNYLP
ncbi:MAG TPA: ECF-type sigma factor [Pyrinomonadaceae bacterium]|nr:ECF-type sigma factor [Pyrinomonadaceae bacterium]